MPLFPKKPFYEQHEILASLSNSDLTIDNLHVFIEYPETIPGIIKGYIIGGDAEAERISVLFHSREIYYSLTSTEYEDIDKRLESQKVKIERIETRGWPIEYQN